MLMGRHPFITEDEQRVLDAGNTLLPMPILSRIVSGEGDAMRCCV
jgi:polyhydroxyalkanoate synthesis regulator protein